MKNKVQASHLTECPPTLRYPSPHEPHASQVVHNIACAVAQVCVVIETRLEDLPKENADAVQRVLHGPARV